MPSRFAYWAALAAAAASIAYGVPQILQVMGVLPDPLDRILIFLPSLILAPCFVLAMAALQMQTPAGLGAWTLSALGLAIMYAVMVSIVYVTQLGVVIPGEAAGDGRAVDIFACCAPRHLMTGVDLLGYTLMSLATLLAAFALPVRGPGAAARVWLIANGLLAPFLIFQLAFPWLIAIGALWLVTFPGAMIALALHARRVDDA
jgi:hypothetical protein